MSGSSAPEIAIGYRRSGGLAGIDLVADVRSGDLSDEDVATARDLLARPPAAAEVPNRGRVDEFDHQLTLTDGESHRVFHWSDGEVPDEARSLLTALRSRAEPTPR